MVGYNPFGSKVKTKVVFERVFYIYPTKQKIDRKVLRAKKKAERKRRK